ncbi:MAG: tape measure protein [Oscillibacter sp.]|nr:tape measure protein [Oscillibacter sp.]
MRTVTETQNDFTAAAQQSGAALDEMAGSGGRTLEVLEEINSTVQKMASSSNGAASGQDRLNSSMRSGASAADNLARKIMGLAAAYVGLQSAQKLINLSDTWTQTTARIDRMNDGVQTTPQVQDMIYNAAQRSRGDYQDTADMVAKLGTLAPDAFDSTAEVVAFAEQINKQFTLAGTNAQGAQAAMLQLTQAMSSGVLRGEELNSVLEQVPTITRAIADYMGVTIGEMRELASEGQITADVVKAAIFNAAEETNAAFDSIPMTFSQAMTMVKNEGLNALRPVLEELNNFLNSDIGRDALNGFISVVRMGGEMLLWLLQLVESGAAFIQEHWDTVSTLLIAGAIAIAAVMTASAIQSAAAWVAANWPLLLIVGSIVLVIYMARQMGATWEDVCGIVGGVLYELYAFGNNLIADAWNRLAMFAEFFANFLNHPITATAHLIADWADWVLSIIQSLASAIDAVFGGNLAGVVNNWRSGVQDWANSFGENEIKIQRMEKIQYNDAWDRGSEMGRSVGAALDNFNISDFMSGMGGSGFDYDALAAASGLSSTLSDIAGDTKAIRNSVALSEEDIKLLVDMATREYVNNINLTAQTPIINVTGQNTGDTEMDKRALADAIKDILIEEAASHTDLAYT